MAVPRAVVLAALAALAPSAPLAAQRPAQRSPLAPAASPSPAETTQDLNLKIERMLGRTATIGSNSYAGDYQIGPEDLLEISVLEAPDLNRTVRVSDDGEISLPLLGAVRVAGLTSRELEAVIDNLLRHTYMKDPHAGVFVREMRSHPVSVFGAVQKPGVYQIREAKSLIEVLSMAEGLAEDAGDTVIVMRHSDSARDGAILDARDPEPARTVDAGRKITPVKAALPSAPVDGAALAGDSLEVSLKSLLDSGTSRENVLVYPGDFVKVPRAGIVYVVGEVHKPGGFLLKTNENVSVMQALALAEGLTPNSAGKRARIVTAKGPDGARQETAVDLDKILRGSAPDPFLHSRDILFVPSSGRKAAMHAVYRSAEGIAAAVSGAAVYRW